MIDGSVGVDVHTGSKGVMFDLESIFFFVVRLQVEYIDLTRAKGEASVYILLIKAINLKTYHLKAMTKKYSNPYLTFGAVHLPSFEKGFQFWR